MVADVALVVLFQIIRPVAHEKLLVPDESRSANKLIAGFSLIPADKVAAAIIWIGIEPIHAVPVGQSEIGASTFVVAEILGFGVMRRQSGFVDGGCCLLGGKHNS